MDLHLPGGLVRQYSLCGPQIGRTGGSRCSHEPKAGRIAGVHQLTVGDDLAVGGPRNHFRMRPTRSLHLIGGGIGITPLLPMVDAAEQAGTDWHLLYLGRTRIGMAYADELERRHPRPGALWPSADLGRYPLDTFWLTLPRGAAVYACGPESLLTALGGIRAPTRSREPARGRALRPAAGSRAPAARSRCS